MHVLAIDTVTEMCSVALSVNAEVIAQQDLAVNRHSNIVLGMVSALLAEAGIALAQLDLIVNDVGPGSFTGIRIGMGVAQGLAYGVDVPVLGVDSLSTLAQGLSPDCEDDILPAIDARMGQIYWACFRRLEAGVLLQGELHLSNPQDISGVGRRVRGCGSGWDRYEEIIRTRCEVSGYQPQRFPLARDALVIGLKLPESNWVKAGGLLPVYLRNDVAKVSTKSPLA